MIVNQPAVDEAQPQTVVPISEDSAATTKDSNGMGDPPSIDAASDQEVDALQRLQERAVRITLGVGPKTSIPGIHALTATSYVLGTRSTLTHTTQTINTR